MTEHETVVDIIAVATDLKKLTKRKHLKLDEETYKVKLKLRVMELAGRLALVGGES